MRVIYKKSFLALVLPSVLMCLPAVSSAFAQRSSSEFVYNFSSKKWTTTSSVKRHGDVSVTVQTVNTFRYKVGVKIDQKSYFSDVPALFSANMPSVTKPATTAGGSSGTDSSDPENKLGKATEFRQAYFDFSTFIASIDGIGVSTDDVQKAQDALKKIWEKVADDMAANQLAHMEGKLELTSANIILVGAALFSQGKSLATGWPDFTNSLKGIQSERDQKLKSADTVEKKTDAQKSLDIVNRNIAKANAVASDFKAFSDGQAEFVKAYMAGAKDAARILDGSYMTFKKGPVTVVADELMIDVTVDEIPATPATGIKGQMDGEKKDEQNKDAKASETPAVDQKRTEEEKPVEAHLQVPVTFGLFKDFRANFSVGLAATRLIDQSLTAIPVANSSPQTYTIATGPRQDAVIIPTALLHLTLSKSENFSFGPIVGVGGATGSIRYLAGGSLTFGREQRMCIDFGFAFGQVNRVNGYSIGDTITSSTVPVTPVWRNAAFLGISYNF